MLSRSGYISAILLLQPSKKTAASRCIGPARERAEVRFHKSRASHSSPTKLRLARDFEMHLSVEPPQVASSGARLPDDLATLDSDVAHTETPKVGVVTVLGYRGGCSKASLSRAVCCIEKKPKGAPNLDSFWRFGPIKNVPVNLRFSYQTTAEIQVSLSINNKGRK